MLMLFLSKVNAACSQYKGFATINEVSAHGFVEFKLLDSSIPASEYQNWTFQICREMFNGKNYACDSQRNLNGITPLNSVFLVKSTSFLIQNYYTDILLKDSFGNEIDYFRAGNITPPQAVTCTPAFDWYSSFITSFDYRRKPDGTGDWERENGNSGGSTAGDTNDVGAQTISVSNITVNKGSTATFTLSIPTSQASNVSIQYSTLDSSALAGTHYTAKSGTATISAGSTSTTVSITTTAGSPAGTVFFYLFLSSATNGSLANHYPTATLLDTPTLDHFEILHDGAGLTCQAENITIKACANVNCSSLSTDSVTLNFQADGVTKSTPTFTGSTVVSLVQTTPATLALSVDSPSISPTNPLICDDGVGSSCNIVFSEAGFILSLANHLSCEVPSLTIQAVKLSDTGTSCAPAYSGNQSVDFVFNYANPTSGTRVPILAATDMGAATVTQNRSINFDGTGTANLSFQYKDAGQISVTVSDAASVGLSPSSVSRVVSPAKLIVASLDANADCASNDANCSAFKAAGDLFNLTVSAACADNSVTPNFEMNNIALSVNTVAPSLGNPVSLGVSSINIVDADNGIHTLSNQSLSEVGVFTINAVAINYLATTSPSGISASLGRFYPHHFELVINPAVTPKCGSFTYGGFFDGINAGLDRNGQSFTLAGSITAQNLANATTLNYTTASGFAKLTSGDISLVDYNVTLAANASGRVNYSSPISFSAGVSSYSDTNTNYQFDNLLTATPFNLRLDITATDPDDNNISSGLISSDIFEVRLGRMILQDSYGPETGDLEMRLKTEYFDGTLWSLNTQDSCSTYQDTSVTIGPYSGTGGTSVQPTVGTPNLFSGVSLQGNGLWFNAPGDGNYGSALVNFDLATQSWLQYDWDSNNSVETFTSGTLNFGYYRGSDRVIYWQER